MKTEFLRLSPTAFHGWIYKIHGSCAVPKSFAARPRPCTTTMHWVEWCTSEPGEDATFADWKPSSREDHLGTRSMGSPSARKRTKFDIAMFGSQMAADGFIQHSNYNTQTINFNVRYKLDDRQNFYFKAITNWLNTKVPTRVTQGQFFGNERQAGGAQTLCTPGTYNGGCANALLLDQGRVDRRTIIGGIYERQIDANTVLTVEADYDLKDIQQSFSQIFETRIPITRAMPIYATMVGWERCR